jgi:hypothetical protein
LFTPYGVHPAALNHLKCDTFSIKSYSLVAVRAGELGMERFPLLPYV